LLSGELAYFLAATIGGLLQTSIGIGFSIVAGPVLVLTLGAKSSVPLLLFLNLIVSTVAIFGLRRSDDYGAIATSLGGSIIGIAVGSFLFTYLTEKFVTAAIAVLLIAGAMAASLRPRQSGRSLVTFVGLLSGIATAWTATPGPVMALGLLLNGYDGASVRRLVQLIALVSYAFAFAVLDRGNLALAVGAQEAPLLALGAVFGSLAGLFIGPLLPVAIFLPAIRALSAMAGMLLLVRLLAT
jgi:uncharacterized protein